MSEIKVKLVRSTLKQNKKMKANIKGLGLRKIGHERSLPNTPAVRGMIKKAIHMLEVKE